MRGFLQRKCFTVNNIIKGIYEHFVLFNYYKSLEINYGFYAYHTQFRGK